MPERRINPRFQRLRIWLEGFVMCAGYEKLPQQYSPRNGADSCDTASFARTLLNEVLDQVPTPRPRHEILADGEAFRDWVEERQGIARRVIMAQVDEEREERRAAPRDVFWYEEVQVRHPAAREAATKSHPLWDSWLDG